MLKTRRFSRTALLGFLAVVMLPDCSAQPDSIAVCGVQLRLGQPQTQVVSQIEKQCKEVMVKPNDTYYAKSGSSDYYDMLRFENGALKAVEKTLEEGENSEATEVLATFLSAIERSVGGTPSHNDDVKLASSPATVVTSTTIDNYVSQSLALRIGDKTIEIIVSRPVANAPHRFPLSPISVREWLDK